MFKNIFKNIKIGIKNLIKWFRIIWADRWWDFGFLYEIINFKLKDMEYNFNKFGLSESSNKKSIKMRICIDLIDKLIEDDYFEKYEDVEQALEERKKDTEKLFSLLANNIDSWWD